MTDVDILSYLALLVMISARQATQRIPAAARRRARVAGTEIAFPVFQHRTK